MKKKKDLYVEDLMSKQDANNFMGNVENLHFAVRKNYPAEDIAFWMDAVAYYKKKFKKVL